MLDQGGGGVRAERGSRVLMGWQVVGRRAAGGEGGKG